MGYSKNLCELMERSGVSSYKLAKTLGVHITTVTNWRDGTNPKAEHLKLVADFFGITVDSLLSDSEVQPQDTTQAVPK